MLSSEMVPSVVINNPSRPFLVSGATSRGQIRIEGLLNEVARRFENEDNRSSHNDYMRMISAIVAKNRFGQLLDATQRKPMTVTRNGRPAAAMLSVEDHERVRGCLGPASRRNRTRQRPASLKKVLDQLLTSES